MTAAGNKLLCCTLAMIALVFGDDARAVDSLTTPRETSDTEAPSSVPAEAPALGSGWTGFYVGAHAGVSGGYSAWSATRSIAFATVMRLSARVIVLGLSTM